MPVWGIEMTSRIAFSLHESIVLLDAYLSVINEGQRRTYAVRKASEDLRKMAINNGLMIDGTYQNVKGIQYQMASMESAYIGRTILIPATKLFTEAVLMYRNRRSEYEKILREAKSVIEGKTESVEKRLQSAVSTEDIIASDKNSDESKYEEENLNKLYEWFHRKIPMGRATQVIAALNQFSEYAVINGITSKKLFQIADFKEVDRLLKVAKENRNIKEMFRGRQTLLTCGLYNYSLMLNEMKDKNIVSITNEEADTMYALKMVNDNLQQNKRDFTSQPIIASEVRDNNKNASTEAVTQPETISEISPYAISEYKYDFNNLPSLRFTKPIKATYFNEIVSESTSWQKLFMDLLKVLYKDYADTFKKIWGIEYSGSRAPLVGRENDLHLFRRPGEFAPGMYVELNRSASEIIEKLKKFLDECNVGYENVVITYSKKAEHERNDCAETQQGTNNNYDKIYQKLYYISKVYDDPNGMTLQKIMSLVGTETDKELVISILSEANWAVKISDDIYSFSKNVHSALREPVQTYDIEENNVITDSQFFDYLYMHENMAEASCRSYVSAIRTAEVYAQSHNYESYRMYDCPFEEASALMRVLMGDGEFLEFNTKQHNRFRAAFKKYLEMGGLIPVKERKSTAERKLLLPVVNTVVNKQPDDFDKEKFEQTLLQRYRNGMQFDSIDFENFREMYDALFDETLSFDDEALEERLRYCGVIYKDRIFPAEGIIDINTKEILFSYIDNSFSSGKAVLYYKAIYKDLSDAFASCFTLTDEKMLKAYIEYSAEDGKYYFFSDYMSVEQDVKVDHTKEIEECFLSAGKPMMIEDACNALSHIPQEQVERIIKADSRFLRNAKSEYFHKDIFEISDEELKNIAEIINGFIDEDEYAIWTDVWNVIQDKLPLFIENNIYLSALGIRNVISQHYIGRFRFEGAVVSLPRDSFAMRDIYQLYAKHHREYTIDDVYNLSKKLDTVIYFDALSEVSVRVSHDVFVSKDQINFETELIDSAIESFMSKDYIRIREIDSFLTFPYVGCEWNEYLLESFLISYSKKFTLLNNGLSQNNVAGAIVKKNGKIKEFEDACAAVLAESQISLKKSEALNYLADVNMITRRSYKDLDSAIRKATQIRNRKE